MAMVKLENLLDVSLLLDLQTLTCVGDLDRIKWLNSVNKAENGIVILILPFQAGFICSVDCH